MKKSVVSALAIAALAGVAHGQAQLQLKLIPQIGTPSTPAGAGVVDQNVVPAIALGGAGQPTSQRFELYYRVIDTDLTDDITPAGLSACSIDITVNNVNAGTFTRALLTRFERQTNTATTPPVSPDLSGLPTPSTSATAMSTGLHSPFRGGMADANNNTLPANGTILQNQPYGTPPINTTGITGILPLAISQTNQGNTNLGADNNAWYGLYSFIFTVTPGFGGAAGVDVALRATATPDPNPPNNSFGYFNDGAAVPVQSSNSTASSQTLHISSIPAPGALALLGLGGLVAGRRRRV